MVNVSLTDDDKARVLRALESHREGCAHLAAKWTAKYGADCGAVKSMAEEAAEAARLMTTIDAVRA
jgi:hypothetical protein